jgi:formylglycine-generating enzyme required for sulfatase activity
MVYVPGGTFMMGRDSGDAYERPAHEVTVAPFYIDAYEVTNEEYEAFVKATNHKPPPTWRAGTYPPGEARRPVTGVTFYDAVAYASWVRKRLPTEEEWEYAARGGDSARMYPWGDTWEEGRANLNATAPRPVGSFPGGRTALGLDDMIGNVWEWTSTTAAMYKGNNRTRLEESDRGKLVVRGGSYQSTHAGNEPVTVTSRRWVARDFRDPVLGFRLVRVEGRKG